MVRINSKKPLTQKHRQGNPYYQSKKWKRKVMQIWIRDQGECQICKSKGIYHPLVKGTKRIEHQGTVDHIVPRDAGGSDELTNLRLIGTNHHAKKSIQDKKYYI